jgi:hypothetical protein
MVQRIFTETCGSIGLSEGSGLGLQGALAAPEQAAHCLVGPGLAQERKPPESLAQAGVVDLAGSFEAGE